MKDMTDTLVCTPVPKKFLDAVWPDIVRVLEKSVATSNGKYDMADIYNGIIEDDYVLWVVLDQDEVVADWLGGSRMSEWLPSVQRVMNSYARDNGCTHLEAYGRKAWGRWLAKYGWEPEYIAYRMELSDG